MAAGCAVVASNLEAFAAVCDASADEPAGMLFPVGDACALACVLRTLIDDPAARNRIIDAGARRTQKYDWSTVAGEVMAVYETIATGEKVAVSH